MNHLDLQFIVPEIVLVVFAIALLIAAVSRISKRFLGIIAFLGILGAFFLLPLSSQAPRFLFSQMLINDGLSVFFRFLTLLVAGLVILLSFGYGDLEEDKGEFYFFILILTLSMLLAVAANNLMMIYITLESISLLSYILAGYLRRDMFSSEAGLKYFLFGALSTGVTLYGVSLVYGLFGTLDMAVISRHLAIHGVYQPLFILAFLLVLVGFGFKCSLVPFHMWTPDVYQGAPAPAAAFFSVGPKAVGFAFLLRVFAMALPAQLVTLWTPIFGIMAVFTMTIGNIAAIGQNNVKRLLAYSTIAQAGYILLGLAAGTAVGIKALLFYLLVYAFMNLGAFGAVIIVSNVIKSDLIEDYAGLYKRSPLLALVLAVSFLSLAGIPPLAGFFAKFFIFAAAVEKGLIGLVIIAALNSVIALYYYVRIIKFAFLHEPKDNTPVISSRALGFVFGIILVVILILGLWPQAALQWLNFAR